MPLCLGAQAMNLMRIALHSAGEGADGLSMGSVVGRWIQCFFFFLVIYRALSRLLFGWGRKVPNPNLKFSGSDVDQFINDINFDRSG